MFVNPRNAAKADEAKEIRYCSSELENTSFEGETLVNATDTAIKDIYRTASNIPIHITKATNGE